MIELQNVTKWFYSLVAVDNVSFEIPQGEVLGLLGPNGAGKTTLLKLIAGFLYPDAGQIRPAGRTSPGISLKPERLLYPGNMRVGQYLKMVAHLSNVNLGDVNRVVKQSLERVRLTEAAGKRIKNCSKGMRQRLGLAQILIGNSPLLLIDEPSNGLDPEGQAHICRLIQELHAQGRTIVLSSHQLHEVTRVCTRIIILNRGKIHYENTMAEALAVRPHVTIRATQDLGPVRSRLESLHPGIYVEEAEVILNEEAIDMRPAVLSLILEAGFDVYHIEQKRVTLEEIYAEVVG